MKHLRTYLASFLVAFAVMAAGSAMATDAQTGLVVKDGNNASQTLCAFTSTSGATQLLSCSGVYMLNASGVWEPVSTTNPLPIVPTAPAGSTYQAGNCNTTANTACTMVASPGSGHALFLQVLSCGNSSATGTFLNLNDAHTLQFYIPPTFTGGIVLPPPVVVQWAAATAATFAVTPSGVTTMSCNFIGYSI